jgi:hypothetical protein
MHGRTTIKKTSLCVLLPLFSSLLFHLYVCCPLLSYYIIPASFHFDSAFIFIFYYSFFLSFMYVFYFHSFVPFIYFYFALLLSFFFAVYSLVSCSVSASLFTLLLSQKRISIYFTGPQITTYMSICGLAFCFLSSWPRTLKQSEDRNLQELHVRSASQTVCRGDVGYGVLSVGVPS